ncbi:hypothetical protein I203_107277 [Kwoniella mangroviensis CBS 8507]|uniref:hypothetical protein n=1 Tax=Kwoniella mangroviensis CBS 8507 TaxID=1296122 RepID=UPI0030315051
MNCPPNGQDTFPNEIWEPILDHLNHMDQPSLLNCMRTCSKLATIGKVILPRNLVLRPDLRLDLRPKKSIRHRRSRKVIQEEEQDELDSDPEEDIKIELMEQTTFLTVHSHKESLCRHKYKVYPNVKTLKLILKPRSTPYHRSPLYSPWTGRPKECLLLRNLRPTRVILDNFTIGLSAHDCEGIPIGMYSNVEELILRCGPIPVDDLRMHKVERFPMGLTSGRLKKLVIILPPRDGRLGNTRYHQTNQNMINLARFLKTVPSCIASILVVNLGGYSPGTADINGPWNHPYDLDIAMCQYLWEERPDIQSRIICRLVWAFLNKTVRFISMEEYLWKENWYGVFRLGEVQKWIPYLV